MHLSKYEKSTAYKQIFRNFPTLCAIMRFFFNYAHYALRAELWDFASAHNSGSPEICNTLVKRKLKLNKNLKYGWH